MLTSVILYSQCLVVQALERFIFYLNNESGGGKMLIIKIMFGCSLKALFFRTVKRTAVSIEFTQNDA